MLERLVFLVFCLGMLQTIFVGEAQAVTVDIDLKKNQTLNLLYNQPIPYSFYGGGGYQDVNAFDLGFSFEICSSENTIASFTLYSDSNEVLWEFTDSIEPPPELADSCSVSWMFDFYDHSVWGLPYHTGNPAIDIDQFRDGIGADNLLVAVTILEGSVRITEYDFHYKHTESSSSSSALGIYDMEPDHYDFEKLSAPATISPIILQLLL